MVGISLALTYGKWEALTLLHGKEFDSSNTIDDVSKRTGSMLYKPEFIKVIDYSDDEAYVLWVSKGRPRNDHTVAEFIKKKSESGKLVWHLNEWHICTPANGSPTCFFPWYGGIPEE